MLTLTLTAVPAGVPRAASGARRACHVVRYRAYTPYTRAMRACGSSRGRSVCHPLDVPPHTGDDRISEEEFALYFSKVMKVKTAHAKALFRVADSRTRDGFLEFREFLGLMAILYRHTYDTSPHALVKYVMMEVGMYDVSYSRPCHTYVSQYFPIGHPMCALCTGAPRRIS